MVSPNFSLENSIDAKVCGIDEVGRGALAGCVVAACVYIPQDLYDLPLWSEVNDSKKLSKPKRNALYSEIKANSTYGIGSATAEEIDEINILQATFLAMKRAFVAMNSKENMHALIDGHMIPANFPAPATAVIKGDSKSISIAAASILAKVTRDAMMVDASKEHPHYGWEKNSGYPTKMHLNALENKGISDYHRKTFAPVKKLLANGCE